MPRLLLLLALSSVAPAPAAAQLADELGDPGAELAVPLPPGAEATATAPPGQARYPVPGEGSDAPAVTDEHAVQLPGQIATRIRALDGNLQTLAARGGGNVVNAVLAIVTGALEITLGIVLEDAGPPANAITPYLFVLGGTTAVRGALVDLVLRPNPQNAAITYEHMPMTSREEVRARLRYGEAQLAWLSEMSLVTRIVDASLNMAAAVAVVPAYLAPSGFEISEPLHYFVLIGAAVSLISGIITLASPSPAEQRWGAYVQLRDRLRADHREASPAARGEDDDEELGDVDAELDDELARVSGESGPSFAFSLAPLSQGGVVTGVSGAF